MSKRPGVERETKKELLRGVHDALDSAEIRLRTLAPLGESKAVDLVLQLRRQIIEEFSHVETGVELENDAS